MWRRRAAFSIARLPPIPTMSTRSLDRRRADAVEGALLFVTDPIGGLRCGRSEVDQSLVVGPGPCARPYVRWGLSRYSPSAPRRASPNVNMRWRWIEISPKPMPLSDMARFLSAAPKRQRLTSSRPCASVRAIRWLTLWMSYRGRGEEPPRQLRAGGRVVSTGDRGQPKLSASHIFCWPPPSRSLVDWTRRVPRSRPGSRSTRPSPSPAPAPPGRR